jgi:gluconate 2-dehydrogenase gamma chain
VSDQDQVEPGEPEGAEPFGLMSRRRLLLSGAASVASASAVGALASAAPAAAAATPRIRFFTGYEFRLVTAMAEVIWPTDDLGPGARQAGVGFYIDGQLAGSWGTGDRMYMSGPFFAPVDSGHGWQINMVPRDVYRAALPVFDNYARATYGDWFQNLPAATQNQAMTDLSGGKVAIPLGGATAYTGVDFFSLFRQNVLEGMLADPMYGGNRNMIGWRWVGFPGDPMRRGDVYHDYIFSKKAYPYAGKPLPLMPKYAKVGVAASAARTGSKTPANADTNTSMGGM